MQVINLPEPATGYILGVRFINGIGRTNSPLVASFFANHKGATLTTPKDVHTLVARTVQALVDRGGE
ncbi:hypothetical protein CQ010_01520 [Arthrobacter sp. MYb211]|uniref:hypothetical protein n=1 Tax=unclassified Arthrobacter TaxID=235627 RepID=UPI000CFE1EE7|nr:MULTISPECIES: hypothetical protein [unclassified Arthrobacter]PRA13353.1 hypothetical protein CQ015_03775 [Arthrobacter sp. MYb221]PRC10550.1 hypothetical protein CQ010_01520 [Arthrobacter sp. MYb211]